MTDDAFISFRYAANLVNGDGLVWNPGERVEGYTNFFWTLLIAGAIFFGVDPVLASWIFGISSFCLTLIFTYRLSILVLRSHLPALIALFLLGVNYTFVAYATGGIETQLQTFLFVICVYLLLRLRMSPEIRTMDLLVLSLLCAIALLVRLDSGVIVAPVVLLASFVVWKERARTNAQPIAVRLTTLIAPLLIITGAWLAWKLRFYGPILPNTFYAKVAGNQFAAGAAYLYKFLTSYWLIPFPFLIVAFLTMDRSLRSFSVILISALSALWVLYVVSVGGDFMEFRFFVPVLPFLFILITWVIVSAVKQKAIRYALMAIVLLGDLHHIITYPAFWNRMSFGFVEPVRRMHNWVYGGEAAWVPIGKLLGETFQYDRNVVIAVTAAGAIPFYSRLTAVDMHGLNDPWVAKYGENFGEKIGHQKTAPLSYLQERNVNLVIGHPLVVDRNAEYGKDYSIGDVHRWVLRNRIEQEIPAESTILEIPISAEKKLVTLYLNRSPAVDAAAAKHHWNLLSVQ